MRSKYLQQRAARTIPGESASKQAFRFSFTTRQLYALRLKAQFKLYGGAKGGGKSFLLCRWAFLQCKRFFGNKLWLGRERAVDFNKTTLETWPKAIPQHLYHISKHEKRIFLPHFSSFIDYGGLDEGRKDIDKFNSAEYGGFGLDQSEEASQTSFAMLRGTLRHVLPNGGFPSYECMLSANPKECWLKPTFIRNPSPGDPATGIGRFAFIKALPTDNPFLPPHYIPGLKESLAHKPNLLRAYIGGMWDGIGGANACIWSDWVDACKGIPVLGYPFKRIVANDPAREGDDENVTYVLELTDKGFYRIIYEKHQEQTRNIIKHAKWLIRLANEWGATGIVVDAVGLGEGVADEIAINPNAKDLSLIRFKGGETKNLSDPDKRRYRNLKAKAWDQAAPIFYDRRISLPNDNDLLANQLSWQILDTDNEIRKSVSTKAELKTDYGSSPDRGDTLIMAIYGINMLDPMKKLNLKSPSDEFWDRVQGDLVKLGEKDESTSRRIGEGGRAL